MHPSMRLQRLDIRHYRGSAGRTACSGSTTGRGRLLGKEKDSREFMRYRKLGYILDVFKTRKVNKNVLTVAN